MSRSLNICIISREYPPDTAFGGIATFSRDIARLMVANGHRVTVFSQSLNASSSFDDQGVTVIKLKLPRFLGSYRILPLFILVFNFFIIRAILRLHRLKPFDLIDAPDHLAEGLFASFTKIPLVTRLHTPFALIVHMHLNNYSAGLSYRLIKLMEHIALARTDRFYAPCNDLVKRCQALFRLPSMPTSIFGYPLDLNLFSPAKPTNSSTNSKILFLGRLEQRKGIETLAPALSQVLASNPAATLTMVGSDTPNIKGFTSARKYLEDNFKQHRCSERILFKDPVPIDALPSILADHDILWIPSLYDNFPIVCLNAMACGKAVVVSDAGGLPEMVDHNHSGMVFRAGDAAGLAALTLQILSNPELQTKLGANARKYVEQNCSSSMIYTKTLALYNSAISTSNSTLEVN